MVETNSAGLSAVRAPGISPLEPRRLKHIVFDVDDTLVRGVMDAKDAAWHDVFPNEETRLNEALKIFDSEIPHPEHGIVKGDRYDIIAYMLGCWTLEGDSYRHDPAVESKAIEFKTRTDEATRSIGISPSDVAALEDLKTNTQARLHVVSNVPVGVLRDNLKSMEVLHLFDTVIGKPDPQEPDTPMPVSKREALMMIVEQHDCEAADVLMVGDGNIDRDAARQLGTQFVGIRTPRNTVRWQEDSDYPQVKNVAEMNQLLFSGSEA